MTFSLDTLNPPQREAVTYSGCAHCLILAGAGSGKTRVLTHRIAWLIDQGVDPSAILAITFTNKAAAEMRERAMALVGDEQSAGLKLSTFHAFGARFLRTFATYAGLEASFTIYGESEQKSLIKKVMTEMGIIGSPSSELLESENPALSLYCITKEEFEQVSDEEKRIKTTMYVKPDGLGWEKASEVSQLLKDNDLKSFRKPGSFYNSNAGLPVGEVYVKYTMYKVCDALQRFAFRTNTSAIRCATCL